MKRASFFLALALLLGVPATTLQSQDAEPAPAPAPAPPAPIAPVQRAATLEMLKAMRDANAKLLEQQAATLLKLEEMEKAAYIIKILGKRS
ncbi:hypothetical protein LBMAG57_28150 [Verrucomicrobiota bacterium]|jgi:hypothetical protein|nr:hypothetical protein LBMAG57_28150 [Verrucomicrobiota bacterium]